MTATEGRIKPQSISDDVRAIEEALANKPNRYSYPAGIDGSLDHARAIRDWSENIGAVSDPARLRRVLDTMQALSDALEEMVSRFEPMACGSSDNRADALRAARAALALYEGKQ